MGIDLLHIQLLSEIVKNKLKHFIHIKAILALMKVACSFENAGIHWDVHWYILLLFDRFTVKVQVQQVKILVRNDLSLTKGV